MPLTMSLNLWVQTLLLENLTYDAWSQKRAPRKQPPGGSEVASLPGGWQRVPLPDARRGTDSLYCVGVQLLSQTCGELRRETGGRTCTGLCRIIGFERFRSIHIMTVAEYFSCQRQSISP